jgi:DNA-binding CsgD family transcriptional regulator
VTLRPILRVLTPREVEVVRVYARTGSAKLVAHELGVSPATVKSHLARARERAGVESSVQLVAIVAREVEP